MESLARGSKKSDVDEMSEYIDQIVLLIRHAFNTASYSRRMNLLTGVGTEKVKAKNNLKNQTFALQEDSK